MNKKPIKSLYLYYYDKLGKTEGLFRSNVFLTGMIILFLLGLFCLSEVFLDKGIISNLLMDNYSFSNDRAQTKFSAKVLTVSIGIIIALFLILISFGYYKKWINHFEVMTNIEKKDFTDFGEKVSNRITVTIVVFSIVSVFLMISNFS